MSIMWAYAIAGLFLAALWWPSNRDAFWQGMTLNGFPWLVSAWKEQERSFDNSWIMISLEKLPFPLDLAITMIQYIGAGICAALLLLILVSHVFDIYDAQVRRRIYQRRRDSMQRQLGPTKAINIWEHMQATLLCCNRSLHCPEISRIIASNHKDQLRQDVLKRLDALDYDTQYSQEFDSPSFMETRIDELLHYMSYFLRDRTIYLRVVDILTKDAKWNPSITPQALFEATFAMVMKGADHHPGLNTCETVAAFLYHLKPGKNAMAAETQNRVPVTTMVDRFLELDGETVLIRQLEIVKCRSPYWTAEYGRFQDTQVRDPFFRNGSVQLKAFLSDIYTNLHDREMRGDLQERLFSIDWTVIDELIDRVELHDYQPSPVLRARIDQYWRHIDMP